MAKPTKLWYLVALFLGIFGGIIGYFAVKDEDKEMAKNLLLIGIIVTFIIPIIYLMLFIFAFSIFH
jgi:uncharacterized membrane protein